MAQLWLTYHELAEAFDFGLDVAEHVVRSRGWTRKRSQDSQIRVLLPQDVMQAYVLKVAAGLQAAASINTYAAPASAYQPPSPAFRQAA